MTLSLHQDMQDEGDLELPRGESLSFWLKRIREHGLVHGLLLDTLKRASEHGLPEDSLIVGRGTPPVHEIMIINRHFGMMNVSNDGDERPLDFRELGFGKDVQTGDLLLEVIQQGPGQSGTNVRGERIPFEKQEEGQVPSIQGQIEMERNGSEVQYRSKIDGFLWNNDPNLLKVTPDLVWPTSVDHHLGNVQTQHHVEIKGDVASGFSVQAGKGLVVKGSLERNSLCQSEGDIRIEGGVHQGANISGSKNVAIRFAQGATISCMGDFNVTDYLYDCEVRCLGHMLSEGGRRGGRGSVVGGLISAMKGMQLDSVGSPNSVTTLATGVDLKLIKELGELQREMKWNKAELSRLLRRLPISLADPDFQKKVSRLPKDKKESFKSLWDSIVEYQNRNKSMDGQFKSMSEERKSWPLESKIDVEGPIIPDVKFIIGSCQLLLVDPLENQSFFQKDGTLSSEAYSD